MVAKDKSTNCCPYCLGLVFSCLYYLVLDHFWILCGLHVILREQCSLLSISIGSMPWWLHLCSPVFNFYRMSPNVFCMSGSMLLKDECEDIKALGIVVVDCFGWWKPNLVKSYPCYIWKGFTIFFLSGINTCFTIGKLIQAIPDIIWHFSLRWVTGTDFLLKFTGKTFDCCSSLPTN